MYDAKTQENNKNSEKELKYDCISDRIYFEMNCVNPMLNVKTSYVPMNDILD